jgi:hypothetical protein
MWQIWFLPLLITGTTVVLSIPMSRYLAGPRPATSARWLA